MFQSFLYRHRMALDLTDQIEFCNDVSASLIGFFDSCVSKKVERKIANFFRENVTDQMGQPCERFRTGASKNQG